MFHISLQGAVQVVSGKGPLNKEHVAAVRSMCERLFGKGQPRIVIDLSGVPLLDSLGLELLLDLRDRSVSRGGAVHLAAPTSLCRDILQATGLAGDFAIFDDLNSAVGSFAQ